MPKTFTRYFTYAVVPVAALALFLTTTSASAHGWGWFKNADPAEVAQRQQEMFQDQADLLGTTVDKVKDAWAKGQTTAELAEELGISETDLQNKMKETRKLELKEHLQALVTQGVITQEQADQRYAFMDERMDSATPGKAMGRMMFGGGMGRHGPGF